MTSNLPRTVNEGTKPKPSSPGRLPLQCGAMTAAARHWPTAAFTLSAPSDVAAQVRMERSRLLRLASVLLDNAGKYGSAAGQPVVEIGIALRDGRVSLIVADRGPGIPPEDLQRVFDRFYRSPASRHMVGSGLGLAIAHQIAASCGGEIQAQARPDGGTVMVVELPAA